MRHAHDAFDIAVHHEEVGIGALEHEHVHGRVTLGPVEHPDERRHEPAVDEVLGWVIDQHPADPAFDT